ncbi:MAG TPA: hypothetical protein EYP24_01205 [bacterium (Candidatus Stahlbacteria)]|nr:hypothetical protein [Candidatus Stahlbacteria bacterium]
MERKIYLDLDLCIGCHSCSAACYAHFGEFRINTASLNRSIHLPLPCRQCENALCLNACPTDALKRNEKGMITRSSFHCVGCQSCVLACPFGVMPEPLAFHSAQKCTYCSDREEGPRCVAACPTGAIRFITREELEKVETGIQIASRSPLFRRSR